ncbi:MAG: dihydroxyacetone kinase subunit L [Granulosicoccus sp.]
MSIDRQALVAGISRLSEAAERDFEKLNDADGALGDGDLGITLKRGMELVTEAVNDLPDDLGKSLLQCAQAFTKSSGSSYGTLMATGLMAMAKTLKGEIAVDASRVSELVALACDAMKARGKAELGGKTVLDSLNAIAIATADKQSAEDVSSAAASAVDEALDNFRNTQATIGRARVFGEKTIGMDDPGMLAMQTIVKALAQQDSD